MKTKRIALLSLLSLGVLTLSLSAVSTHQAESVHGYDASSLPTTIDLNDSTESEIRSYYAGLLEKTAAQRQGTNLLKNLKEVLKNGQKYYSYESGTNIWRMYEITDRDWAKSPASSTVYGTYNSTTNKITGYKYGNSASDSKNNPYLHALYVNRNVENQVTAWDDHDQDQWGINREHTWPKAIGFDSNGAGGARGDPMHLVAANGYANNIHSNYFYGYVNKSKSYTDCGNNKDWTNLTGNLRGDGVNYPNMTVFEPQDSDKGDIARICFYMAARYNYLSGSDPDGIDTNNPNLEIVQNATRSQNGYTSSDTKKGSMSVLSDLLKWHHDDPVDQYEIHRNNILYKNFTNNRNPFIDFPEWADYIWGTVTYNGKTLVNHNTNPTGSANPRNDTINGYNSSSTGSVNLSSYSLSMNEGETQTISATSSNKSNITWTTSDSSVVAISSSSSQSGKTITLTAGTSGTATITASAAIEDQVVSSSCFVEVTTPGGGGGEEEEESYDVTIGTRDYPDGYAADGTSGTITKSVVGTDDLSLSYEGINTKSEKGDPYSYNTYTMYRQNHGFIYATSCPEGYYPSNVTVHYGSNTGVSGKAGLSFGIDPITNRDSSVTGEVTKGGTCVLDNSDQTKLYWNFSTTASNVQIASVDVTYTRQDYVTLSQSVLDLEVGDSSTLEYEASGTVEWTSSDPTVAIVSDGEINALKAGTTTITATVGIASDTCTVTVTEPVGPSTEVEGLYFRKITSLTEVKTGRYVIASKVGDDYKALPDVFSQKINPRVITVNDDKIDKDDAYSFILNINVNNSGKVSISNGTSYLSYPKSGTNFTVGTEEVFCTISTIAANGSFVISNDEASPRGLVFYETYNRYGNYLLSNINGTEYFGLELYKEEQATIYADTFMNAFTCDDSGQTAPQFVDDWTWTKLGTAYSSLDQADKDVFVGAVRNESGTLVEQAVARYDFIVNKYEYNNFMERNTLKNLSNPHYIYNESTTTVIVCLTIVISMSTLGVYFIMKKKSKED